MPTKVLASLVPILAMSVVAPSRTLNVLRADIKERTCEADCKVRQENVLVVFVGDLHSPTGV